ncbi:MAG TPA: phosphate ABC transporter permease PstA [Magnetospirillaceae bacterium]|jgi:phosphate transport system permease protein
MTPERAILVRRRTSEFIAVGLAWCATAIGIAVLALILFELLRRGLSSMQLDTFTKSTPPPGAVGGLLNAIVGSLLMTGLAIIVATPVGVLAGTWLAEYGRDGRLAAVIRFLNDTLLSAPSIIIGLFVYGIAVAPFHHFSGWAGAIALALIALPVIVRTTEDMMSLIPESLREAGMAIGAPRWRVIVSIAYRAAASGISTGVLLAVARISGETAPLLFTALNNQFMAPSINEPMSSLPVVIFQFAMSPYPNWQQLAWAGALLISVAVLALNIVARLVARRSSP